MKRFAFFLIALGAVLFAGPMLAERVSFLNWTVALDHFGPVLGNMVRSVVLMLGIVLAVTSK